MRPAAGMRFHRMLRGTLRRMLRGFYDSSPSPGQALCTGSSRDAGPALTPMDPLNDPFGSSMRPRRYWLLVHHLENTWAMQFTMRIKSPQRSLFSSIFAGSWAVALVSAILVRWLLRSPFLSLGVAIRVVGGRVLAVWWSVALVLIAHGSASAGHQPRSINQVRR